MRESKDKQFWLVVGPKFIHKYLTCVSVRLQARLVSWVQVEESIVINKSGVYLESIFFNKYKKDGFK